MKGFFWGRTCSGLLVRMMKRHEDRWVRVLQLGTRVTVLVDVGPVGEPVKCEVCGKPVARIYDTCADGHKSLSEPYCADRHPSSLAKFMLKK